MTAPILDPARKAMFLALIQAGELTRQALAERLHCSPATVGQWMHEAGIPLRARKQGAHK